MAQSTVTQTTAYEHRFDELYQQLNPEQRQAVDAIDGVVMVIAGPGTGKTQLVAMRVANIVRQAQMTPHNVLCVTFTESGVAAMRERLVSIMGPAGYQVSVHTFHSLSHSIIQRHAEAFGLTPDVSALSDLERIELLQQCIESLPTKSPLKPFGNPMLYVPDCAQAIAKLKQEHITPDDFARVLDEYEQLVQACEKQVTDFGAQKAHERTAADAHVVHAALSQACQSPHLAVHRPWFDQLLADLDVVVQVSDSKRDTQKALTAYKNEVMKWWRRITQALPKQRALVEVYRQYQQGLRARRRYDFEDMIVFVVEAFSKNDELKAEYQEQWQYVVVDEYQDTNSAQNELLFSLVEFADDPNLCVVGDDNQSIFRFQGASLENLLQLHRRYESVQVVTLKENYRSPQSLLDAAGALIAHNEQRLEAHLPGIVRELTSAAGGTDVSIATVACDDTEDEYASLVQRIQQLLADDVSPDEIAVICRRNTDARQVAHVLEQYDIPLHVHAGEDALKTPIVAHVIDVLRWCSGQQGDARLWRLLQYPFFGIDPLAVMQLHGFAQAQRRSLLSVASDQAALTQAGVTDPAPITALLQRLASWQQAAASTPLPDFMARVIEEAEILPFFVEQQHQPRVLLYVQALFDQIKQLHRTQPKAGVKELLHYLALLEEHQVPLPVRAHSAGSGVQVMTAHKAKGLEFDYVFLPHTIDGRWGNQRVVDRLPLPAGLLTTALAHGPLEDERRLFYVALTRAKQQVHISYAARDETRPKVPAPFLAEVPSSLMTQQSAARPSGEARDAHVRRRLSIPSAPTSAAVEAFVRDRLTNYALSVTHVNNYLRCPRLFYYRNILRAPAVKTKHMALGTAVHVALRDYVAQHPALSIDDTVARFSHHLQLEGLATRDQDDATALGGDALRAYLTHVADTVSANALLEYSFRDQHVMLGEVPITGVLDKVEFQNEQRRDAVVVDYKTGKPEGKSAALKAGGEYHRQIVFYQLLCDNAPRFSHRMTTGRIDFIQPDTKGRIKQHEIVVTDEDTTALTETVTDMWQQVQSLAFLKEDTQTCGECDYCLLFDSIEA